MKLERIIKSCGLLITVLAVAFVPFMSASAEESDEKPATWIQISPVSERVNIECGQKFDGTFQVSNIGGEAFDFEVYANAYGVQDLSYDPIFDQETSYTQLAKWVTFDQKSYKALAPADSVDVSYHIAAPEDCPGGGQYAVLFAQTIPKDGATSGMGLQTVSRVGELVFANLGGETRKSGEFVSFEQKWWTDDKIASSTVIKNTGNVDFAVNQKFTVTTLFGNEIYNNTIDRSVLPDTSRELTQTWEETPAVGLFNVTNQTTYMGETPVNETKLVLVAPFWLIVVFFTILCLILIVIVAIIIRKVRK